MARNKWIAIGGILATSIAECDTEIDGPTEKNELTDVTETVELFLPWSELSGQIASVGQDIFGR